MRVKDKVCIVTGAAQGIGQCYAETLAREGAKVVFADIQGEAAQRNAAAAVARGAQAIAVTVDVSKPDSVSEMMRRTADAFGGIDVLVNNAAIYAGYSQYKLMELPLDYWEKFLKVNLTSILICTQAVVPYMQKRGKGAIINQSSAGAQTPRNQYSVSKLGVQGFTVGFARELGQHKIRVNCIAPGVTDTAATRGHYNEALLKEMVSTRTALKRLGTVQDIANALLFLASDESDFVTGQTIHVDGGYVMNII